MTREQRLRELVRHSTVLNHIIFCDSPLPVAGMNENPNGDYVRWSDIEAILNEESEGWLPERILEHAGNEYARGWNCCLETMREAAPTRPADGSEK